MFRPKHPLRRGAGARDRHRSPSPARPGAAEPRIVPQVAHQPVRRAVDALDDDGHRLGLQRMQQQATTWSRSSSLGILVVGVCFVLVGQQAASELARVTPCITSGLDGMRIAARTAFAPWTMDKMRSTSSSILLEDGSTARKIISNVSIVLNAIRAGAAASTTTAHGLINVLIGTNAIYNVKPRVVVCRLAASHAVLWLMLQGLLAVLLRAGLPCQVPAAEEAPARARIAAARLREEHHPAPFQINGQMSAGVACTTCLLFLVTVVHSSLPSGEWDWMHKLPLMCAQDLHGVAYLPFEKLCMLTAQGLVATFVHSGVQHLVSNVLSLCYFRDHERHVGWYEFLSVMFDLLIVSHLVQLTLLVNLISNETKYVGFSGVLYGLGTVATLTTACNRHITGVKSRLPTVLTPMLFIINLSPYVPAKLQPFIALALHHLVDGSSKICFTGHAAGVFAGFLLASFRIFSIEAKRYCAANIPPVGLIAKKCFTCVAFLAIIGACLWQEVVHGSIGPLK